MKWLPWGLKRLRESLVLPCLLTRIQAQKGVIRRHLLSPVDVPAALFSRWTKAAAARLGVPLSKADGGSGQAPLPRPPADFY
jgi:hypothetical protein